MKILLSVVGSILLLALACFCLFGFLATFEPTNRPSTSWAFRIGYAVVGIGCIGGGVALSLKSRPQMTVFTIGHSSHLLDKFIALLQRHEIESLVDVRRYPSSRRLPHFNRGNFPKSLEEVRVGYHWIESLGGRRQKRAGFDSPNFGITDESFRNYADHMLGDEFRQGVAKLLEIAADRRTTIMCAEADYRQCHRRLVSDYLVANGGGVQHILGNGELKAHALAEDARVVYGMLTYPGPRMLFD